jgi:hypothetical protein
LVISASAARGSVSSIGRSGVGDASISARARAANALDASDLAALQQNANRKYVGSPT